MTLSEILNTEIHMTIDDMSDNINFSNNYFNASAIIDKVHYSVDAALKPLSRLSRIVFSRSNISKQDELIELEKDGFEVWDLSFFNRENGNMNYLLTNKGNSLKVLSFIKQALVQFNKKYHPKFIAFTADSASRENVYTKLISKSVKIKKQYKFEADYTSLIVLEI